MHQTFAARRIFTGTGWLNDQAIIVKDGIIESVIPVELINDPIEKLNGTIVPAFIDVQVYGAAQKLFSVFPEAATLELMYKNFSFTGTVLFLPTIATNTREVVSAGIAAVKDHWAKGGKGVPGLHLEGPWLNAERRGAHVKEWIHAPTIEEVRDVLDEAAGAVKMITLAPEVCSDEIIQSILSRGIIISAGHSNAKYTEAVHGFETGINTVTHLYNAMSPLHHREPGLVGAALNHDSVRASIIPDGHHVDFAAIAIAKKIMSERLFAITDAVTETNEGPYRHQLAGDKYESNGILSGSALSMHRAFVNLVNEVGIDEGEALRMCSLYPAQLLGCDDRYGKIAPGYAGQFLVLDQKQAIVKVIL
jgi:N-acetylglucosamine-6-phosphate deacetylase